MSDLALQQCNNSSSISLLQEKEITLLMQQLIPQWTWHKEQKIITNTYSFKDYYQTMAFVNVIAQIAHQQDHHPELNVSYNKCSISYSTHSVNGLSLNDFICAAKINTAQSL